MSQQEDVDHIFSELSSALHANISPCKAFALTHIVVCNGFAFYPMSRLLLPGLYSAVFDLVFVLQGNFDIPFWSFESTPAF